ncbi:hypothetical protein [Paenibacillus sp. y28]|uniref:hypothetical protein n=1 Tax=Paenibacillus sp. y28 TaxID=3129110 RepID=UPI00301A45F7
MSNMHVRMNPFSGEPIEVGGVYKNEWGREETLRKGDIFPSDPMLGDTTWELVSYHQDNDNQVDLNKQSPHDESIGSGSRGHIDRGDK